MLFGWRIITQLVLLLTWINRPSNATGDTGYFWHVTDFHYDWTYWDQQLSCNRAVDNPGSFGDYWCDSPWSLINNSVHTMATLKPDADFIIWTGDSVAHVSDNEMDLNVSIAVQSNITDLLLDVFPATPVYATFGNHDFYPNNQVPVANFSDKIFMKMAEKWTDWIVDETQLDNFRKGGYYTVVTKHGLRILALNTNLYYTSNKVTADMEDPLDQFSWMQTVLSAARNQNEQVIVVAHIVPGIAPPRNVQWMYDKYNAKLIELFRQYSGVIVAMHFGHEHSDAFRLLPAHSGGRDIPIFLAPSVTPWRYGPAHNPGIRLVKYNRTTNEHLDYVQYYVNLPDIKTHPEWKEEYTFTHAYSTQNMNSDSVKQVIVKLKDASHKDILSNFIKRKEVSTDDEYQESCDDMCFNYYRCGFTNFEKSEFDACVTALSGAGFGKMTLGVMVITLALTFSALLA